MRSEVIKADTIKEAVQRILNKLKEDPNTSRSTSSRNNVIYFDGWDGLGASAVLRAIAQRLTPISEEKPASARGSVPAGLEFEQVLHIDCSKWESRRVLQKTIAKQLELPPQVMEMFDKQDEEDDFRGKLLGSRAEIELVAQKIYQHIQKLNRRTLVIFHNGSNEEIDLASCCGLQLSRFSTNKVLWTFQGRFRLMPREKVDTALKSAGTTDAFLSVGHYKADLWSYFVHEEATELVAAHSIIKDTLVIIDKPAQVEECFLYMLELCRRRNQSIDYDLAIHGANYWICDGIIKQVELGKRDVDACDNDERSWRTAETLQRMMHLDVEYNKEDILPLHLARYVENKPYWTSPTCGFLLIPSRDIFEQYFNDLRVLKLSCCTFNFLSPPFLCCHNLRFLWLDHCQVAKPDGVGKEEDDISQCFQRLWVLDIRYTKGCDRILSAQMFGYMIQLKELNVVGADGWDIDQLQGRLPNVCKLRIKNSRLRCSCPKIDMFSEMNRIELLDFSRNQIENVYPTMSLFGPTVGKSCTSLETIIIDESRLERISIRGYTNLKDILLSGYHFSLKVIDISGTAVKTLDLTAAYISHLDEVHLLDCEKLCAILWPPEDNRRPKVTKLSIDTAMGSSDANRSSSSSSVVHGHRPASEFDWYISVRDARILSSIHPVYTTEDPYRKIYMEIFSPTVAAGATKNERIVKSSDQLQEPFPVSSSVYVDIRVDRPQQANNDRDSDAPGITWDAPRLPKESCYMHIQDRGGSIVQSGTITVPNFVQHCATILHVRDSLSITILPSFVDWGAEWPRLEWCRIERCPELDCVFDNPDVSWQGVLVDYKLRIFWASQLRKARYIWSWFKPWPGNRTFSHLTNLHLDNCPRLIHVLPFGLKSTLGGFRCLEILEIMWCGDLRVVFPLDKGLQYNKLTARINMPKVKHIHLHELPKLHSICEFGLTVFAPELETVKVRGCWNLKCLPVVEKEVRCDCEKDWFDSLEWDDAVHKTLYKPSHSRYYKKAKLLRDSMLR